MNQPDENYVYFSAPLFPVMGPKQATDEFEINISGEIFEWVTCCTFQCCGGLAFINEGGKYRRPRYLATAFQQQACDEFANKAKERSDEKCPATANQLADTTELGVLAEKKLPSNAAGEANATPPAAYPQYRCINCGTVQDVQDKCYSCKGTILVTYKNPETKATAATGFTTDEIEQLVKDFGIASLPATNAPAADGGLESEYEKYRKTYFDDWDNQESTFGFYVLKATAAPREARIRELEAEVEHLRALLKQANEASLPRSEEVRLIYKNAKLESDCAAMRPQLVKLAKSVEVFVASSYGPESIRAYELLKAELERAKELLKGDA